MVSFKMLRSATPGACLFLLGLGTLAACGGEAGSVDEEIGSAQGAISVGGGSAQACLVGTRSIRIAQRVTTFGALATDALSIESASIATGDANINNSSPSQVRISGAILNGNLKITGAAPSVANGELVNGGRIIGTVTTGAGSQATLATHAVPAGTVAVQVNSGPPVTRAPGNYGAVQVNGSRLTLTGGTYNVASLTLNAGAQLVFDTSAGPININVQGTTSFNGGTVSVVGSGAVSLYSNSSSPNAVTVNAGVGSVPLTIVAPNGGVVIGSRNTILGCVGGKDVSFEPDSHQHE